MLFKLDVVLKTVWLSQHRAECRAGNLIPDSVFVLLHQFQAQLAYVLADAADAGENSVIVSQNPARHDAGVAAIFPLIFINFCY